MCCHFLGLNNTLVTRKFPYISRLKEGSGLSTLERLMIHKLECGRDFYLEFEYKTCIHFQEKNETQDFKVANALLNCDNMLLFTYKGVVIGGASVPYNCGVVSLVVRISLGSYRVSVRWMAGGIQGAGWCH